MISIIKENKTRIILIIIIVFFLYLTTYLNTNITFKNNHDLKNCKTKNNEIHIVQNSNEITQTCLTSKDWIKIFNSTGNKLQSEKIIQHNFEYLYGIHLGPIRQQPINMLEIGLGSGMVNGPGRSIILWKEYFPNATINILEFDENCAESFRSQVKNLYTGDQSDFNVLKQVAESGPYDLIIDDGGHSRKQQINSLIGLWPHVKPGGFFIVEDIFTAFLDKYNDKPSENAIDVMFQLIILLMDGRDLGFNTKFPKTPISEFAKEIVKDLLFVSCFKRACILNKKFN